MLVVIVGCQLFHVNKVAFGKHLGTSSPSIGDTLFFIRGHSISVPHILGEIRNILEDALTL